MHSARARLCRSRDCDDDDDDDDYVDVVNAEINEKKRASLTERANEKEVRVALVAKFTANDATGRRRKAACRKKSVEARGRRRRQRDG